MWRFLRLLLALILAFFLTMLIGGFLLVGALTTAAGISSSRSSKPLPKSGWLYIPLAGELNEYQSDPMPSFSPLDLLFGGPSERPPTLDELRRALEEAATNERVKGIVLRTGALSAQLAQIQQIGRWLIEFRQKSKKPIYVYGEYFGEGTYYLASCADTIIMYPRSGAVVEWNGLSTESIFFRRFFEKWGIKPRVFRVGRFKSAAENFTEEKYSEDNREQLRQVLEDIWKVWVDSVVSRRGISPESLRAWPNQYIFLAADKALERKLIDQLMPWQEWSRRFIPEGKEEPEFIKVGQLLTAAKEKKSDPKIALVYAEGAIGPSEDLQAEKLVPTLQKIAADEQVKAVVLRVNSPGGGVLDSDKIARAIIALKSQKPVIVSMGGVAASGGYYISAYADKIVAEPTTITGSIGVIGILFDVRELLEKEVGLRSDRIRVGGEYADFMSPLRDPTPQELSVMQSEIEKIYEEFLAVVKEGRRFPSRDAVHSIAQGRVWSGEDALQRGLVDTLGGIETALALAARTANLTTYQVQTYPDRENFFQRWLKNLEGVRYYFRWMRFQTPTLPECFQLYWADEVKIH